MIIGGKKTRRYAMDVECNFVFLYIEHKEIKIIVRIEINRRTNNILT